MQQIQLDKFLFRYLADKLRDATSDMIANFYVQNFVFKNIGYLETLQQKYNLPNDILKIHERICELANA